MIKKQFLKFIFFVILGTAILCVYEVFLRYIQGADFGDSLHSLDWWWQFYRVFIIIILVSYLLSLFIKDWGWWIGLSALSAVFVDLIVVTRLGAASGLSLAVPLAWYYIYALGLIRVFAEYFSGEKSDVPKWAIWVFGGFMFFDLSIKTLIYFDILPSVNLTF
ncbi:hypothetical protein ACFL14_01460 [Patescibacteria group bacterium]